MIKVPFLEKTKQKKEKMQPVNIPVEDFPFLQDILPQGITNNGNYYKTGNKYVTSIIVYKFPTYLDDLTFANIFNSLDCVITLDISKKPRLEQFNEISRSLDELEGRQNANVNTKTSEKLNDGFEFSALTQLHSDLQNGDEHIISMTLRMYIYADSEKELQEKVKVIKDELALYNMENCILENEMLDEYTALQSSADTVAQSIPVYQTFVRQYPFWYQSHADPHGLLFGLTPTGGRVLLDNFLVNNERKSFDMLFVGNKGAGKTSVLKSMMQDLAALCHKIMAIDVDGEMILFAQKLGGKVVKPANNSARINPLELRAMFSKGFDNDSNISESDIDDRRANFVAELTRVEGFFLQYVPSLTDIEADEFKSILLGAYNEFGIKDTTDLTMLTPQDFPIFSDVLKTLRDTLYSDYSSGSVEYRTNLTASRIATLEHLEAYLKPLAEGTLAGLFNGISTIDIGKESLIIFDISTISEMGDRVYNAYLFNILALMWGEIYQNRKINSRITSEDDRRFCVAVIPEAHRILNIHNPHGLDFCEKLCRRSRKYDAGLWFDTQSPRDFAPEGSQGDLDKIKNIFAMVQYKCLMQQDESNATFLAQLFPQFTDSEILSTANFEKGEMLLSLGGGNKIRCKRYIPEEDFEYFGGGR